MGGVYQNDICGQVLCAQLWDRGNPLAKVRAFKIPERELSFLTTEQIETLLGALPLGRNKHVTLIAKICLATGAR